MNRHLLHALPRWATIALIVALLGGQLLQVGHLHADHGLTEECVQCQLGGGYLATGADEHIPPWPSVGTVTYAELFLAPVTAHYRLPARGPPSISS